VYSFPEDAHATQDGNEMTGPTLPQLRALDAIDPEDPAIPLILGGGVTTSLVLPGAHALVFSILTSRACACISRRTRDARAGSANVMGGEAAYVKLKSTKNVHGTSPASLALARGGTLTRASVRARFGPAHTDMLIPGAPRALKMACGENPKRVYGGKGVIPSSRMGIGLVLRQKLIQAAVRVQPLSLSLSRTITHRSSSD
jgi:hypothetical protein